MPVYHFTFHAYGTWLPDKPKGYVRRKQGVLAPDPSTAKQYRARMSQPPSCFTAEQQAVLYEELIKGQALQHYRLHAVGMEGSHLHVIVSWADDRDAVGLRAQIKSAMTRQLSKRFEKKKWFVRNASQKRIQDRKHLDYLCAHYLPSHRGLFWQMGMKAPHVRRPSDSK